MLVGAVPAQPERVDSLSKLTLTRNMTPNMIYRTCTNWIKRPPPPAAKGSGGGTVCGNGSGAG